MTLTFWPGFALWRELHHPAERRWWRCRPTARGVELGFRDDGEAEWGLRIVHKSQPSAEDWSSGEKREAAEEQAVVHARRLLDEQLADGFVELSRAPGAQLWELLPALWRAQSPAFDSEALVLAQASCEEPALSEVATWLALAGSSEVPPHKQWWPPVIGEAEQAAARAQLLLHADRILPALVLSLRHPERSGIIAARDALAAARASDEPWLFDGLVDRILHQPVDHGELGVGLAAVTARLCPITDERIAKLRTLVLRAPERSDTPSKHLAFCAGMELALVLAEWAADPRASAALRSSVFDGTRAVTAWAVLKAAQVAPGAEWREALRGARPLFVKLGEGYRERVDTAIAACS
jgi:hypothetical protein